MPRAPKRPCNHGGCPKTISGKRKYCDDHQDEEDADRRLRDDRRGTAAERGYGSRWRKERAVHLAHHPICEDPHQHHPKSTIAGTVVDHIIPHRGDQTLFWDRSNWQTLCKPCHDFKTGGGA